MAMLNGVSEVARLLASIPTAETVTHGALAGPELFGRAWSRLCAGYVSDAIGRKRVPWHRLAAGPILLALVQG